MSGYTRYRLPEVRNQIQITDAIERPCHLTQEVVPLALNTVFIDNACTKELETT
jgi:hypothetical protein